MTKSSRPAAPTAQDRALWEAVSKTVKPLKRRPPAAAGDAPPEAGASRTKAAAPPAAKAVPARPTSPPRPAPMERRLRARIAKGAVAIDARIDLHGLTQAAAHRRLSAFLGESQAAGAKVVLVITGKGQADGAPAFGSERGVLRRLVPIWLAAPDLRPYVIAFETAGRGHGGEGALYVRLRSRRADRP